MLVRLSPQILVIGKRMVAQTAQTRSVAQHDNDNAHDEQGDTTAQYQQLSTQRADLRGGYRPALHGGQL